ncbi:MAG: SRPBCC family protein [Gammaproteobacteria bacterium]|nr:SRPBCC family protein [Gammaproteobacteria bacterium]
MEHIEASIEIDAPPAAVFAVVTDLCRRARFNPGWAVLGCEPLDGPMAVGARYRFITRRGQVVAEHVSRVAVYEPPWRLVLRSETHPDLEIQLTVVATPGGARLTHAESFNRLPAVSGPPDRPRSFGTLLRQWLMFEQEGYAEAVADETHDALQAQIRGEIHAWLAAIKQAIEADTAAEGRRPR